MKRLYNLFTSLLLLCCVCTAASAQTSERQNIAGVVTAESGSPLVGVTIVVDGTNIATATNTKGEFSLALRTTEARTLKASYVGYASEYASVAARSQENLKIVMKASAYDVDAVIVTGSRTETLLKDAPVITRVITPERIEQVNPVDFATLLQYELPGIQMTTAHGSSKTSITYQGLDSDYLVFLIDGERFAGEGAAGNIDFSRINVNDIERIEVTRGAASTLYGSNALGGVVNIITKSATRPFTADLSARVGNGTSGQTYTGSVGFKRSKFSSYSSFTYFQRDSYTVDDAEADFTYNTEDTDGNVTENESSSTTTVTGYKTYNASQKFGYNITDKISANVTGTFYRNEVEPNTKDFSEIYDDIRVTPTLKYLINDKNQLDATYTYNLYTKLESPTWSYEGEERDYTNTLNSGRINYTGRFGNHTLSGGVETMHEYLQHYFFYNSDDATIPGDRERIAFSSYLQEDWKALDNLHIVAGVRGDYQEEYGFYATPKVSVMYRPIDKVTIRANYAMGYRMPTLQELYQEFLHVAWYYYGNENLKPEKSAQYSGSVEFNNNKGLNVSASAYYNTFKDKISLDTISEDSDKYDPDNMWIAYTREYINVDDAKTLGVEVMANYRTPFGLSVMGTYTFVDDYEINSDGYNISTVRPHTATFNTTYTKRFNTKKIGDITPSVALNGQWQGKNTVYQSSSSSFYTYGNRFMASMNMSVRLPRGITAGLTLNNLLNHYDSAYEAGTQIPQTGISVVGNISISIADMFKL